MKMAVMRRFLSAAPFSDHTLRQYAASDDLAMSAFEYAYRSKEIASAIGVEFDKDGMLLPRASTPEKIATKLTKKKLNALEYLVSEFRAGHLNTRSPEFKKRNQEYQSLVTRLNGVSTPAPPQPAPPNPPAQPTPSGPSQGGPSSAPGGPGTGGNGTGPIPPGSPGGTVSRGPNHSDTKDTLDLSGLGYENAPLNQAAILRAAQDQPLEPLDRVRDPHALSIGGDHQGPFRGRPNSRHRPVERCIQVCRAVLRTREVSQIDHCRYSVG